MSESYVFRNIQGEPLKDLDEAKRLWIPPRYRSDAKGLLLTQEEITDCVDHLAAKINQDYAHVTTENPLILIGVLNGSVMLLPDLMKKLNVPAIEMDTIKVESYGGGKTSAGHVRLEKDLGRDLEGVHALVVEDIVDTGRTNQYIMDAILRPRGPKTLEMISLLSKPSRRVVDVDVKYVGFVIDDHFVIGYGMDYEQNLRNLPFVAVMD
ncbi:hypoxanthine phosphoribosyltransferase [Candidatus Woesearchaeota archaeon]|jgi:hypoxanthine phosphoribosyltransferase|nr:hypoxanthine phosphoribosyltransferase [Candidatus Woesearchaeota archaeon]